MDKRTLTISVLLGGALVVIASGVAFVFLRVMGGPAENAPQNPAVNASINAPVTSSPATGINLTGDRCAAGAEENRDNCYAALAGKNGDPSVCDKIADQPSRYHCFSYVTVLVARAAADPSLCGPLAETERNSCEEIIFQGLQKVDDCGKFSAGFAARCRDRVLASRARNADDCSGIADQNLKNSCLSAINAPRPDSKDADADGLTDYVELEFTKTDPGKSDSDGDGLSDREETAYSTDPNKADTDGDGFKDGDEVKNGYNPAGDGKLPTP